MNLAKFFIGILCVGLFNGCVSVEDADKAPAPVPAQELVIQKSLLPSMIVDKEMVLFRGEVVTLEEYLQSPARGIIDTETVSYEYIFDSLSFSREGVLYTEGKSVRIKANNLTSDAGLITSFVPGTVAAKLTMGRSGGYINLNVYQGQGFLRVMIKGEKGGEGAKGPAFPAEKIPKIGPCADYYGTLIGESGFPGARGGPGGFLNAQITNSQEFVMETTADGGDGGQGGEGGPGWVYDPVCFLKARLRISPELLKGPRGPLGESGQTQNIHQP